MSVSVEDDYPYNSETFCEEVRNKLNHEFFETEAFLESLKDNIFDIFGDDFDFKLETMKIDYFCKILIL